MTAIKTEEERARLDELYALVEAENAAAEAETENPEPTNPTKEKSTEPPSSIAGNLRTLLREGNITKREKWIASNYIALYETHIPEMMKDAARMRAELSRMSQFAWAVICRLEKAERAAREQDNHHYYKIFADSVRKLADKLQGVADVELIGNVGKD